METNCNKHLSSKKAFLYIAMPFLFFSCIDNDYDLNKDISLEVNIGGAEFGLPIGSTKNIMLSQLIELDETLKLHDGMYAISKADKIKDIKVPKIDAFSIEKTSIDIDKFTLDFEMKKIPNFFIDGQTIVPTGGKIDIDKPDFKIPAVEDNINIATIPGANVPGGQSLPQITYNNKFDVTYNCPTFPTEISQLNNIVFGTAAQTKGTLVKFQFDADKLFVSGSGFSAKVEDFTLTIPQQYVVNIDPAYGTVSNNKITFKPITGTNKTFDVQFYIQKLTLNKAASFSVVDKIDYTFKFTASYANTTTISTSVPKLNITCPLDIKEINVNTKSKEIQVEKTSTTLSTSISVPDQITKVNSIRFNTDNGMSQFKLSTKKITLPNNLTLSGNIAIKFPPSIKLADAANITGEAGIGKSGQTLTTDVNTLMATNGVIVKVEELFLEKPVVNGKIDFTTNVDVDKSSIFVSAAQNMNVNNLDINQNLEFSISNATMDIKDATFEYKEYTATAELQTHKIDIKEVIPDEVTEIKSVNLLNAATANLNVIIRNVPQAAKLRFSNYQIKFPGYIKFDTQDNTTEKWSYNSQDDTYTLTLNSYFTDGQDNFGAYKAYSKAIKINSLAFDNNPITTENGKKYIDLTNTKVELQGGYSIDKGSLTSSGISGVEASPTFSISPMDVTGIVGKVYKKIDDINDTNVDLSDLPDFLKGSNINLDLQNTSIIIKTINKLEVPVDVNMEIIAEKGGKTEPALRIPTFTIKGATNNDPEKDSTFIYITNKPRELAGYTVIVAPDLAKMISKVPDKLNIKMSAVAETPTAQSIKLGTPEMMMDISYDVIVPFEFGNALRVEYKDSTAVKDLHKDIEDLIEQVDEMTIMVNAENSAPLDLALTMIPVDKARNVIPGITVSTGKIASGIDDKPTTSAFNLILRTTQKGALKALDGLDLLVTGTSSSATAGQALKPTQYLKVTSMKVKIPGGVNIDLDKLK